jgi:hypothetical protein
MSFEETEGGKRKVAAGARPTLSNRCRRTSLSPCWDILSVPAIRCFFFFLLFLFESEKWRSIVDLATVSPVYLRTNNDVNRARVKFAYQNTSGKKEEELVYTLNELLKYSASQLRLLLTALCFVTNFVFFVFLFDSRKNSIVLRTQLSVRVNGIMGKCSLKFSSMNLLTLIIFVSLLIVQHFFFWGRYRQTPPLGRQRITTSAFLLEANLPGGFIFRVETRRKNPCKTAKESPRL